VRGDNCEDSFEWQGTLAISVVLYSIGGLSATDGPHQAIIAFFFFLSFFIFCFSLLL
jgi:hypothetical protein